MVRTMYWEDGKAMILDQVELPHKVEYIPCTDYKMTGRCIKEMNVRGAPAIGITAAMGVALAARDVNAPDHDEFTKELLPALDELMATRPTAVNLRWAIDRMKTFIEGMRGRPVEEIKAALFEEAQRVLDEDIEINRSIGKWGSSFIKDGARVLTHCNAGSLATGGYGTATAPMRIATEEGKRISVFADETRPLLQGARLTSWELMQSGIDVTLITDNSAGALMKKGEIDLVIVGTDRTARNGDVANKIGTYMVAVLAKENNIPFYVAAPISSIDFTMASGDEIPIEERGEDEVYNICGGLMVAPEGVKCRNLAFDVTPAMYVTGIITQKGAFRPADLHLLSDPAADLEAVRLQHG